MSVGLTWTKTDVDARSGSIARLFQQVFGDVATLKSFIDSQVDEDLVALGYTPVEVAKLRSAVNDMAQMGTIFVGQTALPTAKDFRTFISLLWGMGAF